jgi:hypothetical protein
VKDPLKFWREHGTKVLGFAQGTIAALCGVTGIIPDSHLKYWLAASAVLTFWRGFFNTAQQKP